MAITSRRLGEGILYIPDHGVLFCTKHQSAIPLAEFKYHLRVNRDHKLSLEKWLPIVEVAEATRPRLKSIVPSRNWTYPKMIQSLSLFCPS
jgi:hypothetical protein